MFDYLGLTPMEYFVALIAVTLAAIPQSTLGMGFGMVASSSLLLLHPELVPSTVVVMGTMVAAFSLIRTRPLTIKKDLAVIFSGRIMGTIAAFVALGYFSDRQTLSLIVAVLILLGVGLSVLHWKPQQTTGSLVAAGVTSGVMGTFTSMGAPPLGLVYQNAKSADVRTTLNAFFVLGGLFSGAALWLRGWMSWRDILIAISMLPGLWLGVYCAKFLAPYVDQKFRPIVLTFCAISAFAVILRTIFS